MRLFLLLLGNIILLLPGCKSSPPPADLILTGGKVLTQASVTLPSEPTAVAVSAGQIVFVGSDEEALAWKGADTRMMRSGRSAEGSSSSLSARRR